MSGPSAIYSDHITTVILFRAAEPTLSSDRTVDSCSSVGGTPMSRNLILPSLNVLIFVALVGAWRSGVPANAGEAQDKKRVLQAERFELVNKDGKTAALLSVDEAQRPFLKLAKEGEGGAILAIEPDGSPAFRLLDPKGKTKLILTVAKDGSSFLGLSDANANLRVLIDAPESGSVGMKVFDRNHVLRSDVIVDPDGDPSVNLFDANKAVRATLSSKKQSQLLWLLDKDGKVVWQTP